MIAQVALCHATVFAAYTQGLNKPAFGEDNAHLKRAVDGVLRGDARQHHMLHCHVVHVQLVQDLKCAVKCCLSYNPMLAHHAATVGALSCNLSGAMLCYKCGHALPEHNAYQARAVRQCHCNEW